MRDAVQRYPRFAWRHRTGAPGDENRYLFLTWLPRVLVPSVYDTTDRL